jgi:hypothetical protein
MGVCGWVYIFAPSPNVGQRTNVRLLSIAYLKPFLLLVQPLTNVTDIERSISRALEGFVRYLILISFSRIIILGPQASTSRGGIGNIRHASLSRDSRSESGPDDFSSTRGSEPIVNPDQVSIFGLRRLESPRSLTPSHFHSAGLLDWSRWCRQSPLTLP